MIDRRRFLIQSLWSTLLAAVPLRLFADDHEPKAGKFLSGNYAPVLDELDVRELKVIGQLPGELHGLFVRNGPNPVYPPAPYHWFDGDGMLHGVYLKDGKASYLNRFVRTEGFLKEQAAKKCLYGGLIAGPPVKDVANISVLWHHGQMLATWEGALPHRIEPGTLKTINSYDFGGRISHPFTAHPKLDPATGELVYFGYRLHEAPYLLAGVLDKSGAVTHATTIELPRPVMMHDFAITKNYSVFMDLPLVFAKGFEWQPERGARIGILPRKAEGSKIRWFPVSTGWVYHVLNAFEDGGKLTLLACRRKDWPRSPAYLYRWVFDLERGTVTEAQLDDSSTEFPTLNAATAGGNARFGYLANIGGEEGDALIKFDLKTGSHERRAFGNDRHGGEAIFVPSGKAEDDGYLLTYVHDRAANQSELLILRADHVTGEPVARVLLPRRVPYGLHAAWLPGVEEA